MECIHVCTFNHRQKQKIYISFMKIQRNTVLIYHNAESRVDNDCSFYTRNENTQDINSTHSLTHLEGLQISLKKLVFIRKVM